MSSDLSAIQQLQHDPSTLGHAEELTAAWLRADAGLNVASVQLRPSAVSLNSFNGIAVLSTPFSGNDQVFFKTHVEPGGVITEYYNAHVLDEAGYNTLQPLRKVEAAGRQVAIYPVVAWPTMFDLSREVERSETDVRFEGLLAAEKQHCEDRLNIYSSTGRVSTGAEHKRAPIHQLFGQRLSGPRYSDFYGSSRFVTTDGEAVAFSDILSATLTINGVEQPRTLSELVSEALQTLRPDRPAFTVVGHGDDHYGNVFLQDEERFLLFDPAFAGRHDALLDIVKSTYHGVFAQWMYFPEEYANDMAVSVVTSPGHIEIDYTPYVTVLRHEYLQVKQQQLLAPLVSWLESQAALAEGVRPLHLALMCCPLLTLNLADENRFPSAIGWLGLAQAAQMGNWDVAQDLGLPERVRTTALVRDEGLCDERLRDDLETVELRYDT